MKVKNTHFYYLLNDKTKAIEIHQNSDQYNINFNLAQTMLETQLLALEVP